MVACLVQLEVVAMMSFIFPPNESSKKSKSTVSCGKKFERRDAQDEVRRISKLAHSKGQDCQINNWILYVLQ